MNCTRCGVDCHGDQRTLRMSCLYDMLELGIPLVTHDGMYTMKVCKACRADWMKAIKQWFDDPPLRDESLDGIWIRELGAPAKL